MLMMDTDTFLKIVEDFGLEFALMLMDSSKAPLAVHADRALQLQRAALGLAADAAGVELEAKCERRRRALGLPPKAGAEGG